ncbi:hypothetical protein ACLOJK_035501 [Asimina triloba]
MALHYSNISTTFLLLSFTILLLFYPANATSRETRERYNRVNRSWDADNPDPSQFVDIRIYRAYKVIQRFKMTIKADPQGKTATWEGPDICKTYQGFYCEHPPDNASATALAAIDFNEFQLEAPSVAELISQLPDLAFFHANSNKLGGTITDDIAKLPYLYELDFSNNRLTGPFPLAVLKITGLVFLDLRFNSFVGRIPYELFTRKTFPELEVLFLNNNDFSYPIPDSLGESPVNYLTFANNRFTGGIPESIGGLGNTLIEVLFLNNQLSGCLPYQIGLLENSAVFDAGYNRLTGRLPCALGCLQKMEELNFAGNFLYGEIPEAVCKLGNLHNLSLSDNYFTSVGPACEALIRKGVLDDKKNCIHGKPMQRSNEECSAFFSKPLHCPCDSWYDYVPCELAPSGSPAL